MATNGQLDPRLKRQLETQSPAQLDEILRTIHRQKALSSQIPYPPTTQSNLQQNTNTRQNNNSHNHHSQIRHQFYPNDHYRGTNLNEQFSNNYSRREFTRGHMSEDRFDRAWNARTSNRRVYIDKNTQINENIQGNVQPQRKKKSKINKPPRQPSRSKSRTRSPSPITNNNNTNNNNNNNNNNNQSNTSNNEDTITTNFGTNINDSDTNNNNHNNNNKS